MKFISFMLGRIKYVLVSLIYNMETFICCYISFPTDKIKNLRERTLLFLHVSYRSLTHEKGMEKTEFGKIIEYNLL